MQLTRLSLVYGRSGGICVSVITTGNRLYSHLRPRSQNEILCQRVCRSKGTTTKPCNYPCRTPWNCATARKVSGVAGRSRDNCILIRQTTINILFGSGLKGGRGVSRKNRHRRERFNATDILSAGVMNNKIICRFGSDSSRQVSDVGIRSGEIAIRGVQGSLICFKVQGSLRSRRNRLV